MSAENRFDRNFPAPEPREDQDMVVKKTVKAFEEYDADVVAIDAPPGFGKSIALVAIANMIGGKWFYATPLKSLQDQLVNDRFTGDEVVDIRGRNNYYCHHPDEKSGTTVDEAICQRDDDFECEMKEKCTYYSQKAASIAADISTMNMNYLMAEGMVNPELDYSFDFKRNGLIIDECQNITDFAEDYVGITFNQYAIPNVVTKHVEIPTYEGIGAEDVSEWVGEDLLPEVEAQEALLSGKSKRSGSENSVLESLSQLGDKCERFLDDVEDHVWTVDRNPVIRKNQENYTTIELKPLRIGRFLDSLLWSRGEHIVLSSATIPGDDWFSEVGLNGRRVVRIPVGSKFPVENRPIYVSHADEVGKMIAKENEDGVPHREANMPAAVEKIVEMSELFDSKGIVHARSYGIRDLFARSAKNNGHREWLRENVLLQDRDDREGSLQEWQDGGKQVFVSVNMAEGLDLKGDKCRWQVLLKTLYPYMDERVKKRKEVDSNDEFWRWYNQKAAVQMEQAYGRAVRSKEDHAKFYILDKSAKGFIKMNAEMLHQWFLEGIEDMSVDVSRGI